MGALQQALGALGHFGQQAFQNAWGGVQNWLGGGRRPGYSFSPIPKAESPGGYNSPLQPGLNYYYQREYANERLADQQLAQNQHMQPSPTRNITPIPTRIPVNNVISQPMQQSRIVARTTPTPNPSHTVNYQQNITIPYSQTGQPYRLQPQLAQTLMNAFGNINQATNAAQVLNHPLQQTYTQAEIRQMGHPSYNYGENAGFGLTNNDAPNPNGSIDRGLFRINSNTFNGIMNDPKYGFWKQAANKFGIRKWDDMNDPQKNAYMARIIYEMGGWGRWFAAPPQLRGQGAPDLQQLAQLIARR